MSNTNTQTLALEAMRAKGAADAVDLRDRAKDMDSTAVIAEEQKVPVFNPQQDYSCWPVGGPIADHGQVYQLIIPHNAADYEGRPGSLPALWSITHTKDPDRAKPYLPPNGTSGLYMTGECCTKDGQTWRSTQDGNAYPPGEVGTESSWEALA